MKRGDLRPADPGESRLAQRGKDVVPDHGAVRRGGIRLAVRISMRPGEALDQYGHHGLNLVQFESRVLAPLNAVDNDGGAFRVFSGDGGFAVTVESL